MADNKVLAKVLGSEITEQDVNNMIAQMGQRGMQYDNPQGREVVLTQLINHKLLLSDAIANMYERDKEFKDGLIDCKAEHERLGCEIRDRLAKYQDDGKEPNPMAKGMSWVKTNTMLTLNESDETIADLMTDGCNMGVKSLSKYLNKYEAAEEYSKDIAKKLINLEGQFAVDIRKYL